MSENPPSYSVHSPIPLAGDSPPQYSIPETFTVGSQRVRLLVRPQDLKGHLTILHAFRSLRQIVEQGDIPDLPEHARTMDPERRWGWFIHLAVERFDRWCSTMRETDGVQLNLPPVDVVMVWHAYLLNPMYVLTPSLGSVLTSWKLCFLLCAIGSKPPRHWQATPDPLLTILPSPDRLSNWERRTKTPYDPLDAARVLAHKDVLCPLCTSVTVAPFLASGGTGYAQSNFAVSCSGCGRTITKDLLGLHKFVRDAAIVAGPESYLAGTLYTPYDSDNTTRAKAIKKRIVDAAKLHPAWPSYQPLSADEMMAKVKYDFVRLRKNIASLTQPGLSGRVLGAYTDDRPFSIDLVGAVLRQASFVQKMVDLGWTQPTFDDEDDMIVLQHCVARYHGFLDLMADSPGSFFVPTLDIDLAWHTHQLMGERYQTDCKSLVGRYVDHDDKVEEDHLATAFDVTCRAWDDRYGIPYTHCGCPLPGTTVGQRLRRAFSHRHALNVNAFLRPPSEAAVGTHPSDHNAVFPMHNTKSAQRARERRKQKAARRQLREQQEARQASRSRRVDPAHEQAFFYPVPLFYVYPAGCVVAAGGIVNGGGVGGALEVVGLAEVHAVEVVEARAEEAAAAAVEEVAAAVVAAVAAAAAVVEEEGEILYMYMKFIAQSNSDHGLDYLSLEHQNIMYNGPLLSKSTS
ncbi:hypothetical protein HYDPIDRAFT_168332 [Hydnomerulius pinastri MD-312]|uniref:Uncharacterized protein n=1 Tax=Hydnomerulius pinastri MD-312 TaxID=994086 RepID=A0A0C9WEM5_9AGAM|nr:hypothetical protein HYDPIDRAFT_168332 [Hydnomerulius pinastri MD-312]